MSYFLIHPATLYLSVGKFILFTFRWLLKSEALELTFYLWFSVFYIFIVSFSLCFCHFLWWFSTMFSLFFMFYVCSRYMFCLMKVCKKHLIDRVGLFLLMAFYLHLPIWIPSCSSFMFPLSQIIPFCVVSLLSNWSRYSYFYCLFSL